MEFNFVSILFLVNLGIIVFSALSGLCATRKIFHVLSQLLLFVSGLSGLALGISILFDPQAPFIVPVPFFGVIDTLILDGFSAIFFSILSGVSALCAVYAISYAQMNREVYPVRLVDTLVPIFILGMEIVLLAFNPFVFLLGWEIMSMASFFLVMADRSQTSIRAAILYLIMTHLGAAAILLGFMALSSGSVFADFSSLRVLASQMPPVMLLVSFFLFLFGFGSKAGLVPFHVWLPEAHPAAPSHVSALMSGVMLKIAIYGFLRIILQIFPSLPPFTSLMIIGLGLLSAFYGVLYAVIDRDVKRTLAFSSIENVGLIFTMIGIALFAESQNMPFLFEIAILASVFHSIGHAIFKSGLFLIAGVLVHAAHSRSLEKMGGFAKRMPRLAGAFLILALGASALPPFGPFFGEWIFLQGLIGSLSLASPFVKAVLIFTLCVVSLVAGLAVFAMTKLFGIAMLGEPRAQEAKAAHEPEPLLGAPIFVFALCIILMGLYATSVLKLMGGQGLISPFLNGREAISSGFGFIDPLLLVVIFLLALFFVLLLRRFVSDVKFVRAYHTWDCGQPIDASMQYSATAFSAPIRFFFRPFLRTRKTIEAEPIVSTNPWIAKRRLVLHLRSIWMDHGYQLIGRFALASAHQVKRIQSGNIRFYLALMFFTLLFTVWIAL